MSVAANHHIEIESRAEWGYDCVRLRGRAREPGRGGREAVRIFLGTEASQWRAERVFLWSVTRFGDPRRDYEIHRMSALPGFHPARWTTGFTNYRFAIPTFADGRGKAIYNDVDQVYLNDPGVLFDLDLEGRGFLARSDSETSVMLLDCGRMQELWTLSEARARTKKDLHARARKIDGLRGRLDPRWNARDGEHDPARPGVLHFTTLHTQPWRPFPHHFRYEPHALGSVWDALETEAEAADFAPYHGTRRSGRFAGWRGGQSNAVAFPEQPLAALARACGVEKVERFDEVALRSWLDTPRAAPEHEALGCRLDWSRVPAEDQCWILDALFAGVQRLLVLIDRCPDPAASHAFEARVEQRARRHPGVTWHLRSESHDGRRYRNGGPAASTQRGEAPRVWVLRDDRAGNTTQSLGLAETLAWPWEDKTLSFDRRGRVRQASLPSPVPPWPDLIIAAGQRSAPVALQLRDRAHGIPRLVQLGRKGGAHADPFDLVVTPRAARLWPHPRRFETLLPVCRAPAKAELRAFRDAATPRVALLIGGSTSRLRVGRHDIVRLARDVRALLATLGGTLWVTTSRRSPPGCGGLIARELPAARVYNWQRDDPDNPYAGLLTHADLLIVTGESESMLAEAAATHAALLIARVGRVRSPSVLERLGESVVARARRRPTNERGTPAPQQGLERLCAGWVASGRVRPLRDLDGLHRELVATGRARFLEDALGDPSVARSRATPIREAEGVADRVRRLFENGAGPG